MSASSLSASSSRPDSVADSAATLSPYDQIFGEPKSSSSIERQQMQENQSKRKHNVESPSSKRTIEQPHRSRIEETGETSARPVMSVANDWVAREPLPMVNVPRITTMDII